MNPLGKNILLFSSFLVGQIPVLFFGTTKRINLSIFVERSTRLDFATMYYTNAFSFLVLTYMISYPKGIDKRVARFVLIICYLDFLHLLLFAKQGFGMTKIGVAIVVFFVYEFFKRRRWED